MLQEQDNKIVIGMVQFSADLKNWTALTNLAGTHYSATILDSQVAPNFFYRVKSVR
jgi:hypothetical protein